MLDYNDTLNRSKRLSEACSRNTPLSLAVELGDMVVFLRWLVYHQHVTKKTSSFTSVSAQF